MKCLDINLTRDVPVLYDCKERNKKAKLMVKGFHVHGQEDQYLMGAILLTPFTDSVPFQLQSQQSGTWEIAKS